MAYPYAAANIRGKVIENCWNYLHDNFHKFNEHNKIKVILAICGKSVPQEIISDAKDTNIIIVREKKEQVGTDTQALSRSLPIQQ